MPKYPTPKAIKYIDGKVELICATAGLHHLSAYIQDYMDYNHGSFEKLVAQNPSIIIKELDESIRNCLKLLTDANPDFDEINSENDFIHLMLIFNGKSLLLYFDKNQMTLCLNDNKFPGIGTGITKQLISYFEMNPNATAVELVRFAMKHDPNSGGVIYTDDSTQYSANDCKPLKVVSKKQNNKYFEINHCI
jgi:hypothetical protein